MFELHPDLQRDCFIIGRFPLSLLLAMNDANYPWFILVPQRAGVREIFELEETDQPQLLRESCTLARQIAAEFKANKMNIAALGNITPQLHLHHIVRYTTDSAWPKPVWGQQPAVAYTETERATLLARLERCLVGDFMFLGD